MRQDRSHQPAASEPPELSALIDIATLADRLGVTERFVRRLVEERRVPFLKIGKFVRFHPDDIDHWVSARRVEQLHSH